MTKWFFTLFISLTLLFQPFSCLGEHEKIKSTTESNLDLFKSTAVLTGVPWEFLAAMNQFEDNTNRSKEKDPVISIQVPPHLWGGLTNPVLDDTNPTSIKFFNGIGHDANGDKVANPKDPLDALYSIALFLTKNGTDEDRVKGQLWKYYHNAISVDIISHIAAIFKKYQRVDLSKNVFPVPLRYEHSYQSTWGDPRGFGGIRIHEGTDIYAHYGTPVLSTCYGYVELMGWNRFGGWRVGIRDIKSNYHYFAHLNYFKKGLKKGDIVKPGDVIGSVGSSGYGPPGTSGKFPPHLHFGLYNFNGKRTYSYDPYPHLKKWERSTKKEHKTR